MAHLPHSFARPLLLITRFVQRRRRFGHLALAIGAVCSAAVLGSGSSAQESEQWIVLGSDAAESSRQSLLSSFADPAEAPLFEVYDTGNGLTIARIDAQAAGFVRRTVHLDFGRCGGYTVHPTREAALRELNNPVYQPGFAFSAGVFPSTTIDQNAAVTAALEKVDAARIVERMKSLQDLRTRFFQSPGGEQAADLVTVLWSDLASERTEVSVERVNHDWPQIRSSQP